ncbi:MAG: hypothetical protein ACRC6I_18110 [Paracoccaceae bacterium]
MLDNYVCEVNGVRVRGGGLLRNTAINGPIESIFTYLANGVRKTFSIGGSPLAIYNISSSGAPAATGVTGLATPPLQWSATQFTTSGGSFLVLCGDGNPRQLFDGSSWTTAPAITGSGLVATKLAASWSHANRLFFVESGSKNAWYLPADAIGGAAVKFPLGGIFRKGGNLLCGATWTADAGADTQSRCVFASSEGELAVYEGPDPATWSLRGVYEIARLAGPDALRKAGGDLLCMTEDGIYAISQIEQLDAAALAEQSVSKDIRPLWRQSISETDRNKWQITRHDPAGYAIVSVPGSPSLLARQYVVNLQSSAWSRFLGWQATCFCSAGSELLYGDAEGRIFNAEKNGSDNGAPYTASWISQSRSSNGGAHMTARSMRAIFRSRSATYPRLTVKQNYSADLDSPPPASQSIGSVATWEPSPGETLWDMAKWGGSIQTYEGWKTVNGHGHALAACVEVTFGQPAEPQMMILRVDAVFEAGEAVA